MNEIETNTTDKWQKTVVSDMENTEVAHLAGVFDAIGNIKIAVTYDEDYKLNHELQPRVTLKVLSGRSGPLFGKIMEYADNRTVKYSMMDIDPPGENRHEKTELSIKRRESIVRFLEPLMPHLVLQYQNALMMIKRVVPLFEDGRHLEKDGILRVMHYADSMRGKSVDAKYTQKYFKELWSIK